MTKEEAAALAKASKVAFQAGDYATAAMLLGQAHSYDATLEQAPDGSIMQGAEELSA